MSAKASQLSQSPFQGGPSSPPWMTNHSNAHPAAFPPNFHTIPQLENQRSTDSHFIPDNLVNGYTSFDLLQSLEGSNEINWSNIFGSGSSTMYDLRTMP